MMLQQHARVVMSFLMAAALFGCSAPPPVAQTGVKVTDIDVGRSWSRQDHRRQDRFLPTRSRPSPCFISMARRRSCIIFRKPPSDPRSD